MRGIAPAALAVGLCVPGIASTGSLVLFEVLADWDLFARWASHSPVIRWMYLAIPLPAFVIAAYGAPLLLLSAAAITVRVWRGAGARPIAKWATAAALVLGIASLAFFYLVVEWWELSFLP